ncbi:MAG: hypothetical protein PVI09_15355 [Anaerolineae bacterium]|jgi:hypothetical protein
MIRIGKDSNFESSAVLEKAAEFFGPGGVGLDATSQDPCCARFEGAGGYVYVQTTDIEDQKGSTVTVEGREWENQIKQFMREI